MKNSSPLSRIEAAEELLKRRKAKTKLLSFCDYVYDGYLTPDHIVTIADKLEAVERGEITRLIITVPPRHGKSQLSSILFPCWFLGRHPTEYIVQSGYAESIALTHSRKARDIFVKREMGNVFPEVRYRPEREAQRVIIPERQAAHEWGTTTGGSYYAVGIGGGLTGRGFDLGIIDDPVKDAEEAESEVYRERVWDWYTMVFRTRLAPGARIIVIMTRWHQDDLVGRLLAQQKDDPTADQWDVVHMKAINEDGEALWPDRYPVDNLLKTRASMGTKAFISLFQGDPTIAEGEIIKREWWQYYEEPPEFSYKIQSWDTAFKDKQQNDYSVCTTWGIVRNAIYLIGLWRAKVEFPELKQGAEALYLKHKPRRVLVEDKASGQSLIQELRRHTRIPLLAIKVDQNKVARANAATPLIEAGKVYLPKNATWLHDFIEECSAFPNAAHDDMVDSLTQTINYLVNPGPREGVAVYDAMADYGDDVDL